MKKIILAFVIFIAVNGFCFAQEKQDIKAKIDTQKVETTKDNNCPVACKKDCKKDPKTCSKAQKALKEQSDKDNKNDTAKTNKNNRKKK